MGPNKNSAIQRQTFANKNLSRTDPKQRLNTSYSTHEILHKHKDTYSSTTEALFKSRAASIVFLKTFLACSFFYTVGFTVDCVPIQPIQSISVYNDMPPNTARSV